MFDCIPSHACHEHVIMYKNIYIQAKHNIIMDNRDKESQISRSTTVIRTAVRHRKQDDWWLEVFTTIHVSWTCYNVQELQAKHSIIMDNRDKESQISRSTTVIRTAVRHRKQDDWWLEVLTTIHVSWTCVIIVLFIGMNKNHSISTTHSSVYYTL